MQFDIGGNFDTGATGREDKVDVESEKVVTMQLKASQHPPFNLLTRTGGSPTVSHFIQGNFSNQDVTQRTVQRDNTGSDPDTGVTAQEDAATHYSVNMHTQGGGYQRDAHFSLRNPINQDGTDWTEVGSEVMEKKTIESRTLDVCQLYLSLK